MQGHKQGKTWGSTKLIYRNSMVEVHEIEFIKDHYCSLHRHDHKNNMFYVIDGELEILVKKNEYDLTDITILGPGDSTVALAGEYHQFKALTSGKALEIYFMDPIDPHDIVRATVGK